MSDRDDFWDIEKLLPKRAPSRMSHFRTETPISTYAPDTVSDTASRPDNERKLTAFGERGVRATEDHTYIPSGAGLVKRVCVKRSIDKYDFYDSFRKSALLYFDCSAAKCDFAQFYSYMPQYAHLTPSQKNYYLWWRSRVRVGEYPKTDYSYLYLYVYEILNLPDRIPPKEGIALLCRVWREYRKALPRIDNYFTIWVADYCLVHALPCPINEISDFLFDCIGNAPLKEFYLSDITEVGLGGTEALLAYLSDYDWRRGKHASDSLSKTVSADVSYRTHMIRAMYLLLSDIWESAIGAESAKRSVIVRDAFPSTLCTHSVKCKLEIEYVSFTESAELREAVSAAVRYTENKLRALLGVRSRLAVKGLPEEYAAVIDRYFAKLMAEEEKRRKIASRPEYERLYEAPREALSLAGAGEIERLSWINAERLIVDKDELTYVDGISHLKESPAMQASCRTAHADPCLDRGVLENDSASLPAEPHTNAAFAPSDPALMQKSSSAEAPLYASGASFVAAAPTPEASPTSLGAEELAYLKELMGLGKVAALTTPIDSLAERINEIFVDLVGDILLEPTDDGYQIIEDYREEAEKLCSLP